MDEHESTLPDPEFSRELFLEWRSPRCGTKNPDRMNNPVWEWLVRTRHGASEADRIMNGPSVFDAGPCWCFERFGQSENLLPDGRTIMIGGVPDWLAAVEWVIYNDVVAFGLGGEISIYGYPEDVFPPTDYHTATQVGSDIIVIGNLGYDPEDTMSDVFVLNTESFEFRRVATSGEQPGWIYDHEAYLSRDRSSITISGGKVCLPGDGPIVENFNDWRLDLDSWSWQCVERRTWQQWKIAHLHDERGGAFLSYLPKYRYVQMYKELGEVAEDGLRRTLDEIREESGREPDMGLVERLYRPGVPHEVLPADEWGMGAHRIKVEGVTVRFVETPLQIEVVVEGALDEPTVTRVIDDVRGKLEEIEGEACSATRLI